MGLRLAHARFGFSARGTLVLTFEREERRVLRHLANARDRKRHERSRRLRGDAHVLTFDITG